MEEAKRSVETSEARVRDHQKEKGAEQSEGLEAALKPDGALPEHMLNAMLANFDKVMESFVKQAGPEQGRKCAEKSLRALLGGGTAEGGAPGDTGSPGAAMLVDSEAEEKSFREALVAEGVEGKVLDKAVAGARKARRASPYT